LERPAEFRAGPPKLRGSAFLEIFCVSGDSAVASSKKCRDPVLWRGGRPLPYIFEACNYRPAEFESGGSAVASSKTCRERVPWRGGGPLPYIYEACEDPQNLRAGPPKQRGSALHEIFCVSGDSAVVSSEKYRERVPWRGGGHPFPAVMKRRPAESRARPPKQRGAPSLNFPCFWRFSCREEQEM
jgi:hypothetical protein